MNDSGKIGGKLVGRFQFDDLDNIITTACNGIFGDIETKRTMQAVLSKAVILSCMSYNSNSDFKNKIDRLAEFYNLN